MIICKVRGKCLSTVKHPGMSGLRLVYLDPLDISLRSQGGGLVAVDPFGCKEDDTVLVVTGTTAGAALEKPAPVDALIVGLVDK